MMNQTLSAYEWIQRKILNGEWKPGYFISTKSLANELPFSRTPIREALKQLESEGLTSYTPGYGATVRELSSTEFQELLELRTAIEVYAAGLAAERHSPEDLAFIKVQLDELKSLCSKPSKKNSSKEQSALVHRDVAFHSGIIQATKNSLLIQEMNRLQFIFRIASNPLKSNLDKFLLPVRNSAQTYQSHRRIFMAIKSKKPDLARIEMMDHLSIYTNYIQSNASSDLYPS